MTIARPRRNRVTPEGRIEATPHRGSLMGNRGDLHDESGNVVRRWRTRRWISCILDPIEGRVRFDSPGFYTPLFFHDEAVALAAGHRPCGQCRPDQYARFRECWLRSRRYREKFITAGEMDRELHPARTRLSRMEIDETDMSSLPSGVFVRLPDDPRPHLWTGQFLRPWSHGGYGDDRSRQSSSRLTVLTPQPMLDVLKAGYIPAVPNI